MPPDVLLGIPVGTLAAPAASPIYDNRSPTALPTPPSPLSFGSGGSPWSTGSSIPITPENVPPGLSPDDIADWIIFNQARKSPFLQNSRPELLASGAGHPPTLGLPLFANPQNLLGFEAGAGYGHARSPSAANNYAISPITAPCPGSSTSLARSPTPVTGLEQLNSLSLGGPSTSSPLAFPVHLPGHPPAPTPPTPGAAATTPSGQSTPEAMVFVFQSEKTGKGYLRAHPKYHPEPFVPQRVYEDIPHRLSENQAKHITFGHGVVLSDVLKHVFRDLPEKDEPVMPNEARKSITMQLWVRRPSIVSKVRHPN